VQYRSLLPGGPGAIFSIENLKYHRELRYIAFRDNSGIPNEGRLFHTGRDTTMAQAFD
jgi:hypothetical protein